MDDDELIAETPWGKLITAKGLEILLTGFNNDLERLNKSISQIKTRLDEIEALKLNKNVNSRIQALEGSLKSLEDDIHEFRENQTHFAAHMKKTLELFYTRLGEYK